MPEPILLDMLNDDSLESLTSVIRDKEPVEEI
jgi:hypothetical protein